MRFGLKNSVPAIFAMFLKISIFIGIVPVAAGTTWFVDDSGGKDFTRIQDAVNASLSGDAIIVRDGTIPVWIHMLMDLGIFLTPYRPYQIKIYFRL